MKKLIKGILALITAALLFLYLNALLTGNQSVYFMMIFASLSAAILLATLLEEKANIYSLSSFKGFLLLAVSLIVSITILTIPILLFQNSF